MVGEETLRVTQPNRPIGSPNYGFSFTKQDFHSHPKTKAQKKTISVVNNSGTWNLCQLSRASKCEKTDDSLQGQGQDHFLDDRNPPNPIMAATSGSSSGSSSDAFSF